MKHKGENMRKKIDTLFSMVDAMKVDDFIAYFTDDVLFRFGNGPLAQDKETTKEIVIQFFASIKSLRHIIEEMWEVGDTVLIKADVEYTRHDGSQITIPFMNYMRSKHGLFCEYYVYIDVTPLYNPG